MKTSPRRDLFNARSDAVGKVNAALSSIGKKLWRVSETDSYKLMRLLVWSMKYSVSLEYILSAILPVLSKSVERRTGKKSKGLGVRISVLTGSVAKDILLEKIAKDFPGGENVFHALDDLRTIMVAKIDNEEIGKPRSPLAYKTSSGFSKAYAQTVARKQEEREKIEDLIAAMPFRRNPFR